MNHLTKYEKETILLISEGDDTHSVYIFNPGLKRKLAEYSRKYPDLCRLTAPYSEERKKAAVERAKQLIADKASQG